MEKYLKIANIIWLVDLIYFYTYNSVLGWNKKAESDLENDLDIIFKIGILVGFILYFTPLLKIYRRKVEEIDNKTK